jgi:Ca2+:H+ antiporter
MPRWLSYLMILAIVAPILELVGGAQLELAIFIASAISLMPLAAVIGRATENLEYYVGPTASGLLNATFGNAPELIIGIFALQAGLISVVKASIAGSIIGNVLLVLGTSLAVGGWRWGKQYFSNRDAGEYSVMMILAVAALLIPFAGTFAVSQQARIQSISNAVAVVLLVVYALYLSMHVFHLRARRRGIDSHTEEKEVEEAAPTLAVEEDRGRKEAPKLWLTLLLLLIATVGTAWNSELLVGAIKPVTEQIGWSQVFIGLVIIPIIGNAAEHSSAVYIAYKDRVDLSMAIAAGSSIQVATFVAPLLVLISLFFATPLNLIFQPIELVIMGMAAILFALISLDGESSWLSGLQLFSLYLIACIVFFFIP